MGKGQRLKKMKHVQPEETGENKYSGVINTFLQKAVYDDLFYTKKDPMTANLLLLIFEIEAIVKSQGVKSVFGNFAGTGAQLSEFMKKNQGPLLLLFGRRFPDPIAYSFTGNLKNKGLDKELKMKLH